MVNLKTEIMPKGTLKILYHDDGRLLFSRYWPEVPPVMNSIYADTLAMNSFNDKMRREVKSAIPIRDIDRNKVFEKIAFNDRIDRDRFYDVDCEWMLRSDHGNYEIEIIK